MASLLSFLCHFILFQETHEVVTQLRWSLIYSFLVVIIIFCMIPVCKETKNIASWIKLVAHVFPNTFLDNFDWMQRPRLNNLSFFCTHKNIDLFYVKMLWTLLNYHPAPTTRVCWQTENHQAHIFVQMKKLPKQPNINAPRKRNSSKKEKRLTQRAASPRKFATFKKATLPSKIISTNKEMLWGS